MILVTGGTGLVGSHLLYFLVNDNQSVRAIKRKTSNLTAVKNLFLSFNNASLFDKIEWVNADILDVPSLEDAFKGVAQVYHCAAKLSFATSDYQELLKANIEGTANVVNLCIAHKVDKLCHVSSVAALGTPLQEEQITEKTDWNPEANNNGYAISKYGAEMEVWRGSQEGIPVIIVQPSVIIGEGHWNSGSGTLFTQIKKGIPKYPKGGTGFVDVKDVVQALTLLMNSTLKNESFILSGTNSSYLNIISKIATRIDAKIPKKPVEDWQLKVVAFFQKVGGFFTGKKSSLNKNTIYSMQHISAYNGSKITRETAFKYQPLIETINRVSSAFKADH